MICCRIRLIQFFVWAGEAVEGDYRQRLHPKGTVTVKSYVHSSMICGRLRRSRTLTRCPLEVELPVLRLVTIVWRHLDYCFGPRLRGVLSTRWAVQAAGCRRCLFEVGRTLSSSWPKTCRRMRAPRWTQLQATRRRSYSGRPWSSCMVVEQCAPRSRPRTPHPTG